MLKKDKKLLPNARSLRREMTPQENSLWFQFLRKYPVKFYRQRIIDNYIVDFYCEKAKLVVEVDGSQHYEPEGIVHDQKRTEVLEGHGLQVIRFSNREVNQQFRGVCEHIHNTVVSRIGYDPFTAEE